MFFKNNINDSIINIIMYTSESIKSAIEKGLKNAHVEVKNPRNDNEHFIAYVEYEGFKDKNLVEQHRMVYDLLKNEFGEGLHSLSLKTKIKNE